MAKSIPALSVAEDLADGINKVISLSTGVRVKIRPVSAVLIDQAMERIPIPPIPNFYNDDKAREEPNPNDPAYIKAMEKYEHDRSMASVDVIVLMGVILVDPISPDKEWLYALQDLERLNLFDLSPYDMTKERDREFVYKRFIACGNDDLKFLTMKMGVTEAELNAAEAAFPDKKA